MHTDTSAIRNEMNDTRQRYTVFVDKLKEKLHEFATASIIELKELNDNDEDEYKQTYHRMQSAVLGQVDSLRKKAHDVLEEKVTNYRYDGNNREQQDLYYELRNACYDTYNELDELVQNYREQIQDTFSEDLEGKYQLILDEYERIKDAFSCTQCGGKLTIDKLYFTTTYIACPYCQTQNTFEPSSRAKSLEHLGRSLAEKRTKHLLDTYHKNIELEQELFQQKHRLEMDLTFSGRREAGSLNESAQAAAVQWENTRTTSAKLYEHYLRAMFDEWNKINPGLTNEHERFYQRMLQDHQESHFRN